MTDTTHEAAQITQAELEADIQRCLWGINNGGTSKGRKAYFKRLVWLEEQRETLYGISAPIRKFNGR